MSISLAIVDCQGCCTLDSISHRSAEMKKYAKSRPGNVWVRDRRGSAGMTCSSNPTRLQTCQEQDTPEPSK